MDWTILTGLLAFVTLAIVVYVALRSKRRVDDRRKTPEAPKSTLAADAPSKGKPADV
ncbi:hypothetical protein [Sulfitobacter alexandrii]|uniref:hypothetical protein n=1 Tax=Sulfitobacter alexandrii TaxID=1917485 RepID=UPI0015617B0D|nr:hypothetical protein [Sulfitobacter alexandrii]